MTDDLVAFLRARLDEDEQAARDAGGKAWAWEQHYGDMCNDPTCEYGELSTDDTVLMNVHGYDVKVGWQGAAHIARHDPARVLREIEAKRRMLEAFATTSHGERTAPHEDMRNVSGAKVDTWRFALRLLALSYADHDDYRDEWRP